MSNILKIMAAAFAICVACALAACGNSTTNASTSSSNTANASTTAAAEESAATESEAATDTEEGTENGSSYENEHFGIHYDLPEGWTFEDDATLAETNSQSDAIASDTSIDMVAYSPDKSSTVTIGIEGATEYNDGQSAEEHLANQVKEMVESAEGDNVSYLSETATLTFDGSDTSIPATATTLTVNGNELHVLNAVLENEGNFLSFVVQAPSEEEANAAAAGLRLILE